MNSTRECWICGGNFAVDMPLKDGWFEIDCTTCGRYRITPSLHASRFPLPNERHRLSYVSVQRTLDRREPLELSSHTLDAVLTQLPNASPMERSDLLLLSLGKRFETPNMPITFDSVREYSLACATQDEVKFHFRMLMEHGLLQKHGTATVISYDGWRRIAELATRTEASRYAFVALRFSSEMLALVPSAFTPAIREAGFEPLYANEPPHNDRIDARIVTDILRSRFVIADVTDARPNVYFEAGYALGQKRPVIWTCRSDREQDMHFDTRQYSHILWKDAEDLRTQLYYRVRATI